MNLGPTDKPTAIRVFAVGTIHDFEAFPEFLPARWQVTKRKVVPWYVKAAATPPLLPKKAATPVATLSVCMSEIFDASSFLTKRVR